MFRNLIFILFISTISISCAKREARYPVVVKSGTDYQQSIELAKKINQKEERQFKKYALDNKLVFERSNFGFQYIANNLNGDTIKTGDLVRYNRTIESLNGQVIYPKQEYSLLVGKQVEINGIHEGLKLLTNGANAIFLFPSHQAYGYHGDDNKISSNTPLLFRIEILNVEKQKQ